MTEVEMQGADGYTFFLVDNVGLFGTNIVKHPEKEDALGRYNIFIDKAGLPIKLKDIMLIDTNYFLDHIDEVKQFAEEHKRKEETAEELITRLKNEM
jgi:hypothetical protein